MQVLLKRSEFRQDVRCSVCGQGFRLYWEPTLLSERDTMRIILLADLRQHHAIEQGGDPSPAAHPADLFRLPNWVEPPRLSRAARLHPRPIAALPPSHIALISSRTK
ncbi:MAG: hypothetical protein M3Y50_02135 [Acidobacteriota bacterium]|nr:hypothetical protein [Acidobacteriota bacterium]